MGWFSGQTPRDLRVKIEIDAGERERLQAQLAAEREADAARAGERGLLARLRGRIGRLPRRR
jgi:hypothetical protein